MLQRFVGFSILALGLAISGVSGARPKPKTPSAAVAKPLQVARPTAPATQRKSVEVLWGGSFWQAEVLEVKNGLTKIHYTGWGNEWDEWVEPNRLRSSVHPPLTSTRAGQKIEVEWHGSWWDAEVVDLRAGLTKIHYTGWGNEWDEWIEQSRMRSVSSSR